jgi:glycosyltransferase involved in cell wall biosynthesis
MAVNHAGRFLEPALRSLASQTFKDFEVILVDNNSRDGSDRVIAEWAAKDERIRCYRMDVLGSAKCLNFAASVARAPLFARLDGTNILLPDRLRIQHARMEQEPQLGLLGACVDLIDVDGNVIGRRALPLSDQELRTFLRHGNPFVQSTIMMRRAAFEAVGGYRVTLRTSEDYDLWCRMAEVTQMANVPESLARFRVIEGGIPTSRPIRMAITDACIIAAARARESGKPEPLINGTADLRAALSILKVSREDFRYQLLKNVVGITRNAVSRGDIAFANRMRDRALMLARGLPIWRLPRGLAHVAASYFPSGSRRRRKLAFTRLFGVGRVSATDR